MTIILAAFLSFIPAFLCAAFLYWIDRYEKEPKVLLGMVFWWGALIATGAAMISQLFLEGMFHRVTGSEQVADVAGTTLFAPLTEESLKGAAVLLVFLVLRREFDSVLDGLVYAGIVALGFAATENTLYLWNAGNEGGIGAMIGLWVLRVVLGAWDHSVYTAWIGLGLATSRLSRSTLVRWLAPPAGWGLAVAAHALHNGLATASSVAAELGLAMFLIDWMGWFLMAVIAAVAVWRERSMLRMQLAEEVMLGVLDSRQYHTASSYWPRLGLILRALSAGRLGVTNRFYRLAGELAHKKQQLARFGDVHGTGRTVEELRAEMRKLAPGALPS